MSELSVNRISGYTVLGLSLFSMLLVVGATVLTMLGRFDPCPTATKAPLPISSSSLSFCSCRRG
jgi:hypothetical protein